MISTAKPSASSMLSVCDGRLAIGFILRRGRSDVEGFTAQNRSLGLFPSENAAAAALEARAQATARQRERFAMSTCRMCGSSPCVNPSFCAACRRAERQLTAKRKAGLLRESAETLRARRLLAPDISLERAWCELNNQRGRAAASTVEALAYQLRAGPSALREPSAQHRLAQLDERQMREFCGRLTKERWGLSKNGELPPRVPPWKPDEIESLAQLWGNVHG